MDFLVFNPVIESKIQNPKWGGIFAIGLTFAMWGVVAPNVLARADKVIR